MVKQFRLKTDEKGLVALQDGHPVYVNLDTNEEEAVDVNELFRAMGDVAKEAKKRRETNKTLMEKLKAVEGIEDLPSFVSQAKEQMEGKSPKVSENEALLRKQIAEVQTNLERKLQEKDRMIEKQVVQSNFNSSTYFAGAAAKTILPPAIAHKVFGDRFRVETEDGDMRLIAMDSRGEPVYSRKNPETFASFDEAIDLFLQEPAYKDLVKFNGAPGSGNVGSLQKNSVLSAKTTAQHQLKEGDVQGSIRTKLAQMSKD